MRRSTAPGPITAPYSGTKFFRASGRCAIARKNGLGLLVLASRLARTSFSPGSTILIAVGILTSIGGHARSAWQRSQKIAIALHEIERCETFRRFPPHFVKDQIARLAREARHAEKNQLDRML